MSYPTHDPELDSARTATVDRLILSYGHGRLGSETFEQRLDRAFEAKTLDELTQLTADLEAIEPQELPAGRPELYVRDDAAAPDDVEHMVNILSGTTRGGAWTVPREIRMFNLLGGGELDFTEARFSSQVTRVKLICVLGGAEINVPEGINVCTKVACLLGGVENRAPSSGDPAAPTLIIEGFMLLAGAEIKVKKTLKERLVEFADTLRQTFRAAM